MQDIVKIIEEEYQNPYPKDIFLWNNKEKLNFNRGRFNEFIFNVVENTRRDIIKIIQENIKIFHNNRKIQSAKNKKLKQEIDILIKENDKLLSIF